MCNSRDCSSKWPIRRVRGPPKALGNRPTLPHVALGGEETWFSSTTAYFCTIHGHFQSFFKGSSGRTRTVFQPRNSAAASGKRNIPCPSGFDFASQSRRKLIGSFLFTTLAHPDREYAALGRLHQR